MNFELFARDHNEAYFDNRAGTGSFASNSKLLPCSIIFPPPKKSKFKFIDLFAGIGGFRLALQNLGGSCVFTSEWDEKAQKTYAANFGDLPFGDITQEITKQAIPNDFDVLCAGFPCQAFSIAGRRGGFEDTRGTLFFEVAEIIKRKKPKAFWRIQVRSARCLRDAVSI